MLAIRRRGFPVMHVFGPGVRCRSDRFPRELIQFRRALAMGSVLKASLSEPPPGINMRNQIIIFLFTRNRLLKTALSGSSVADDGRTPDKKMLSIRHLSSNQVATHWEKITPVLFETINEKDSTFHFSRCLRHRKKTPFKKQQSQRQNVPFTVPQVQTKDPTKPHQAGTSSTPPPQHSLEH